MSSSPTTSTAEATSSNTSIAGCLSLYEIFGNIMDALKNLKPKEKESDIDPAEELIRPYTEAGIGITEGIPHHPQQARPEGLASGTLNPDPPISRTPSMRSVDSLPSSMPPLHSSDSDEPTTTSRPIVDHSTVDQHRAPLDHPGAAQETAAINLVFVDDVMLNAGNPAATPVVVMYDTFAGFGSIAALARRHFGPALIRNGSTVVYDFGAADLEEMS